MEDKMIIKIHMGESFSEYGEENTAPQKQLNYVDQIIKHMNKEHGACHTLSFEIIFEI